MLTKTKYKNLIKLVFGLALLFYITWRIIHEPWKEQFEHVQLSKDATSYFILFTLLMPLNWGIEIIKWRFQMKGIKKLSVKESILSVLAGISTGLLTPNRIGNFIGRNLYVEEEIKVQATLQTLIGNMAQFTATVIAGLIGLSYLGTQFFYEQGTIVLAIACIILFMALLIFYQPGIILKMPFSKWLTEKTRFEIGEINNESIVRRSGILALSLIRYVVFLIQYFVLLYAFSVGNSPLKLLAGIAVVYLITTLIPSLLFGKLFVREASALFILTSLGIEIPVILITVFVLWLVNLAIPSLMGAYVLIRK